MQTTKCRAVPLDRPNGKQVWRVTHPYAQQAIETFLPHDHAGLLLLEVLDAQTDRWNLE
jgi:hypothetical protein